MNHKTTAVHVTHEAIGKIGGIGAVLEGLFTAPSYLEEIERSILVCPLFNYDGDVSKRLGEDGEVLYSSIDGLTNTSYYSNFRHIEAMFNVNIVYGRRTFVDEPHGIVSSPEILLIDVSRIEKRPINEVKAAMFREFGLQSNLYEHIWDYEQWMRLGPPALAAIKAIGCAESDGETVIVAHEYMGMPTALAAKLDDSFDFKTVFYAHEVATMRPIVEKSPGHDTMFYNVMENAHENGMYVNEVFGDQNHYFKHALVDASRFCDTILAVGDYVVKELKFMAPEFDLADIDLTYNGIPAFEISMEEKHNSKRKLQDYCYNLLGLRPDYVFTHVTRMTPSKGLWRDFKVLGHMDAEFGKKGKTGVLLVLSTETSKRRKRDIYDMEAEYNWPVAHREGMPDMSGGEAKFYTGLQEFNAKSRNIKAVLINQFGFDMNSCGQRMPYDMEFMDIRKGSDAEFGQSIYEPFGIAQLEPLSFGGICVVTNVCGCAGFVKDVTGGRDVKNVIVADYTDLDGEDWRNDLEDLLSIDKETREHIEHEVSQKVARQLCDRLPVNDAEVECLIASGYDMARHMSWNSVVKNYVMKSLHTALRTKKCKEVFI
ncbi:MAG: glycosyltransferase [Phycisphaerae bacterium]|nr:glycosyltransferase [Phycisphaerae bacterium]